MTGASRPRRPRDSRLAAAVAAVVVVALTGCGSTVAGTQQMSGAAAATGGQPNNGQLGGQLPGVQGGSLTPGTGASQPTTATGPGGAAPGTGSTGGSSTGALAQAPAPGTGTVVKAKPTGPIEIGFIAGKCSNCGAALGPKYSAGSYSDQQFEQAAVDGLNARGGIGGRKIRAVFAEVDTASADWSTDYQAACAKFTEDNHVVAVLGYSFAYMDNFAACLAKFGVVWINGGYAGGDSEVFRKQRNYFTHIVPTLNAALEISVSSAVADGWVTPESKLGILQTNCPTDTRAFNNTLKPYLAANQLNLVNNTVINCVSGARDQGNAVAGIQSAVLKMKRDGVDNVIITAIPLILFAENAESQGYRPQYLAFLGGAAYEPFLPVEQLKKIHAAGWLPTLDLNATQQPPLSPAQRTCKDLLGRGGVDPPPAQYTAAFIACDGVLLYARAVQASGGDASPRAVIAALEGLGSSYQSAMTLGGVTTLGPGRHDAPRGFRSNTYQSSCACFQYVGPTRAFPRS